MGKYLRLCTELALFVDLGPDPLRSVGQVCDGGEGVVVGLFHAAQQRLCAQQARQNEDEGYQVRDDGESVVRDVLV